MITMLITLRASAKAAANILHFVEEMVKAEPGIATVEGVMPVEDKPKRNVKARPTQVQVQQVPVHSDNPYVVQAIEASTMRGRIQSPAQHTGRNRVVYVIADGTARERVLGVPLRVLDAMVSYPDGMKASEIETATGLKRKSVESAVYHLRTIGVIRSVDVTT